MTTSWWPIKIMMYRILQFMKRELTLPQVCAFHQPGPGFTMPYIVVTFLCLSLAWTWIYNAICCGHIFAPFTSLDLQCHILWSHFCAFHQPGPGFTMPYVVVTFVPFTSLYLDLQCHMLWSFLYSMGWDARQFVLFIDIGGIVNHHCLNFLLIILSRE